MADRAREFDVLLATLQERGSLSADERTAIEAAEASREPETPWFVHPFVFAGALVAGALLTVGLLELFGIRYDSESFTALGLAYLGVAVFLYRSGKGLFAQNLALALSVGGHGFLLAASKDWFDGVQDEATVLCTSILLCAVLYPLIRSPLHRFLSCLLVFVVAKFAVDEIEMPDLLHVFVAVATALCAGVFALRAQVSVWRPLAYACAGGLVLCVLPLSDRGLWFEDVEMSNRWVSSIVLGFALWFSVELAVVRSSRKRLPSLLRVGVVAAIVALSATRTPGIPASLFLAVLGYATWHRGIAAFGLAALPVFAWKYYYSLEQTLLVKSAVLVTSGVVLLLARYVLRRVTAREGRGEA